MDFAKGKVTLKSIGESAEWIVKKLILENRAPFLEKLHLFCEGYIVFYKSIVEEISKKANEKAIFLKVIYLEIYFDYNNYLFHLKKFYYIFIICFFFPYL